MDDECKGTAAGSAVKPKDAISPKQSKHKERLDQLIALLTRVLQIRTQRLLFESCSKNVCQKRSVVLLTLTSCAREVVARLGVINIPLTSYILITPMPDVAHHHSFDIWHSAIAAEKRRSINAVLA